MGLKPGQRKREREEGGAHPLTLEENFAKDGVGFFAKGRRRAPKHLNPQPARGECGAGAEEARAGLPLPALTLVRVEIEEESLPGVLVHRAGEAELQLIAAPGLQGFAEL